MGDTKARLLAHLRAKREAWERTLAEIGEERMEEPGLAGGWSFKDVVGHLLGWRHQMLNDLADATGRLERRELLWPSDLDLERDLDRINEYIYRAYKDRPLAEVLQEARDSYERIEEGIAAMSEEDLTEAGRFSWAGGKSVAALVLEDMYGHWHEEHEPDVRAWLGRRP